MLRLLLLVLLAYVWLGAVPARPDSREIAQVIRRQFPPRIEQPNQQRGMKQEPPIRTTRDSARRQQQAEHLYRIGRQYVEQGYYSEALDALNQSLALRPNYARALTYKGICLRALREPRLALQHFDEALAVSPGDGVAHGERGLTHIVLGDRAKAEDDIRRAAQLRPDLTPWFAQESRRLALTTPRAYAAPGDSHHAEPQQPPATVAEAQPSPAPGQAEPEQPTAASRSPHTPINWGGLRSILLPAVLLALSFLALVILLRIAFSIARFLLRAAARTGPFRSRWTPSGRHQTEQPFQPLPPYDGVAGAIATRPFLHRHRALLLAAAVAVVAALVLAMPAAVQAFRLDPEKLTTPRARPTVLDFRGNIYTQIGSPDIPINFSDLPTHLVDALRAREDSRFFEHHGVDWFGLGRALVADVRHMRIKQGGSTLTMQLAEKAYRLDQKGLLNRVRSKIVEWTMAQRSEAALARQLGSRRAAKEAIMVAYLNRVEFGDGTVGVGAASLYYFEKPVSKLTLGESCMLVALLRAPYANSPYRKPENSRLARDKIIAQMLRRGYITEPEAKKARFHVVKNPKKPRARHNGYLVAAITREMNSLKGSGKLPADVWDQETLSIESTLDLWAQDIVDSEVRKVCSSFRGDTEEDPLGGAAMLLDNATGHIRALVAGQDYRKSQYDLALSSRRQVASVAKPFVYGAYLEQGGNIAEGCSNGPLDSREIRALNNWNPENASSLDIATHTLSTGLAFSDNYITIRVGLNAGLPRVYNTLYAAGLVSDKSTTGPTWLLGTAECTLADAVSAYSSFPRGGTRASPFLVQSVSIEGREVYRAEPRAVPLFTRDTCEQLHGGLREAMTDGTGRTAMRNAGLDASVAGKTGTSQNSADVWWVGYVKDVTLGVRFGRNSNAPLGEAAAGGTLAAPVAARVLKKISERYSLNDPFPSTHLAKISR